MELWKTYRPDTRWLRQAARWVRGRKEAIGERVEAVRTALWLYAFRRHLKEVGEGVRLIGRPLLRGRGRISLGDGVILSSGWEEYHLALHRPVKLDALLESSEIVVGAGSILHGTHIFAVGQVRIGRRCMLAGNTVMMDCNYHPLEPELRHVALSFDYEPVVLGDNVWIGLNTILLPGASVGENSVIGAGSVVTRPIPPDCVAAGNQARVIRRL